MEWSIWPLGGYIVHPIQVLLDYPIAFGCLGLAGAFRERAPFLGVVVGMTGRFLSHFVSGVIYFADYAPEGMSPIIYSAIYNGTYILPELAISLKYIRETERRELYKGCHVTYFNKLWIV